MAPTELSFYVGGHPDDPLLFPGHQRYWDLQDLNDNDAKVVHVITTAGDAGLGQAYWRSREQGLVNACTSVTTAHSESRPVQVNGKQVQRASGERWVCYFLRLPDGNTDGSGYPVTGNQSLRKLRDDGKPMTTVDGAANYQTWEEFWTTLRAIFDREREGLDTRKIWVNASDDHVDVNPDDHPDHYATAAGLREFVDNNYNLSWWVSYHITAEPEEYELKALDLEVKRFPFYVYGWEVHNDGGSTIDPNDGEWNNWGTKYKHRLETVGA